MKVLRVFRRMRGAYDVIERIVRTGSVHLNNALYWRQLEQIKKLKYFGFG
jgi:hypothetical protein